jgi:molybdopterin synthase catalytic subunit
MVKIVYFDWVRENIGCTEEIVTNPPQIETVKELIAWLAAMSPCYDVLRDPRIPCGIDHIFVSPDTKLVRPHDCDRRMIHVEVRTDDIDTAAELARLETAGTGAVASFTGLVRDTPERLAGLELESYLPMAQRALLLIAVQSKERWALDGVTLIHRHGLLPLAGRIVFVGAPSAHRTEALDDCNFPIDWAKTRAPFWKREIPVNGRPRWVEARLQDDDAAQRWDLGSS